MPGKNKRELKQKEEKAANGQELAAEKEKDQKFIDLFSGEGRFKHDLEILTNVQFEKSNKSPDNSFTTRLLRAKKVNLFKKLREDLAPQTVLEEILLERITMAYHWVFVAEVHLANKTGDEEEISVETYEDWWNLVERANNQLMRTIEALSNLRRSPITVVFKQPGQVNVGNQQVNVTKTNEAKPKDLDPN